MGRFDGVLLCSDLDGTLLPESRVIPERSLNALRRFIDEGGRFGIATGRARQTFASAAADFPMNAPAILANGALIYDLGTGQTLHTVFLPDSGLTLCEAILLRHPNVAVEAHTPDEIYLCGGNRYTEAHQTILKFREQTVDSLNDAPRPWLKALFVGAHEDLIRVEEDLARNYAGQYGVFFSHPILLELQSPAANKGEAVAWLANHLGVAQDRVFTIGDFDNDISMISRFHGFAPAGAREVVKKHAKQVVCSCADGALADVIEILERMISYG